MVPEFDLTGLALVSSDDENPFIRYRGLLHSYRRWRAAGRADAGFVDLVAELDAGVMAVDGGGFRRTPLRRFPPLDERLGARVWVKDETVNVTGSHKGRHLFGLMLVLTVAERLGSAGVREAPLAIASCGNAALAAATIAAAAKRHLDVFVPVDVHPAIVDRLRSLGSEVHVSRRSTGTTGDPCYRDFRSAVKGGGLPFGCQGSENGLTIEGGATLGWELAEAVACAGAHLDRLVVQVGGGALASATFLGLEQAVSLGVLARTPIFDTVQTQGAFPLARAHAGVLARIAGGASLDEALDHAAHHRSRYMRSWETVPVSIADGILDDETYDWLAVVRGMASTGGSAVVVDEATLVEANHLARTTTGIDVDETGSAGLAGLLQLSRAGQVPPGSDLAVIFSGRRRTFD